MNYFAYIIGYSVIYFASFVGLCTIIVFILYFFVNKIRRGKGEISLEFAKRYLSKK